MKGIHDFNKRLTEELGRLSRDSLVSDVNKKLLFDFKDYQLANGMSKARVGRYMSALKMMARDLTKSYRDLSKEDVIRIVGVIESRNYTNWTKVTYKTMLKRFITWLAGTEEPPESVKWVNLSCKKTRKLPEELLTQDEVKRMIEQAGNARNKALIATLYETGCRIGELGNLLIKHVEFDNYGAVLMVDGKTGQRRVRIIVSVPYLADWLNKHPAREPNKPVWVSLPPNNGDLLCYPSIKGILRVAAKEAGITKRVNPHSFRHARATHLSSHLTEAQMKEYIGWTQDSSMASVYIHLSGRDVDNALLRVNGIIVKDDKNTESLKLIDCFRCHNQNKPTDKYCSKCGLILNVEDAIELEKAKKQKDDLLDLLINDPDVKKILVEKAKVLARG